MYEDETLAHRLQDEEFGTHYELNRSERRQVGGDVRKSRVEQELEDRFAAEYRAQRRRDRCICQLREDASAFVQ